MLEMVKRDILRLSARLARRLPKLLWPKRA
jgi:hypothetical protein